MNSRETTRYSNHTALFKNDPEYWKFSFDEIGRYDIAAVVDHVLSATGERTLTLLSLSQGVTTILVFLSTRPEYNDKTLIYPISRAGYIEIPEVFSEALAELCEVITGDVCSLAITVTLFTSPYQLNETRLPVYLGHYPIGTTIQNFMHYYQVYKAKDFVMYDYGTSKNLKRYGQAEFSVIF
ncbi:hypothetical protein HPB50_027170 [Hyalomma asiaticum]|uniref:Uncharacterized protein n=1 Tax=Hyalomma asiaticum TaxID=266040 RepID=A0ACB7RQW7_HYAAI|nr:hypothetical protein HPB50_027170 [Hyalomma asiaticum]